MAVHPCALLADPEGYGWHYATEIQRYLARHDSHFDLVPVHVKKFRDGECKPYIEKNIIKRNCYFVHDSTLHPDTWTTRLKLIGSTIQAGDPQEIIAILPYLRWSRQDKEDEDVTTPISAGDVADILKKYAKRVMTIDVHNPSIKMAYRPEINFKNLHSFNIAIEQIRIIDSNSLENVVIMSTDVGGITRAKAFADIIGAEFCACDKTRPHDGEVEKTVIIGDVKDKHVLEVDDMADSGGSAISGADEAMNQGAKSVSLYIAHGLFTKGIDYVAKHFKRVYVGDTLKINGDKPNNVQVLTYIPLFGEAIRRTSEGLDLKGFRDMKFFDKPYS